MDARRRDNRYIEGHSYTVLENVWNLTSGVVTRILRKRRSAHVSAGMGQSSARMLWRYRIVEFVSSSGTSRYFVRSLLGFVKRVSNRE